MPLYSLQCPDCLLVSEHFMGMDDNDAMVKCPGCEHGMTRERHRHYMSDIPQIQGDTVAGGCNYSNYYDEGLDCYITSKRHRADEMKRQGVVEYAPDPDMKKHRDEQRYIRQNSVRGDADAAKAIRKEVKAAKDKRIKKSVDRAFDKAPLPTLPEL